nr:hypothetical protein [Tanacetum cinerariifolium]
MSSSTVTYTLISSDHEEPSDAAGSLRVIVYRYDMIPMHLVDRYVKAALEDPKQAPPSLDYPLPDDASPAAQSPGYITDSDLEEDPIDYLIDRGDDDDDESSNDVEDDDVEEEHLALANSSVVPAINLVLSVEDTEAFKTDESAPTSAPIAEYASAPTPPSPPLSLLSLLSSPLPQIPSPPLLLPSSPTTNPTYAEAPLGYKAARIDAV